MSLPPPRDLGHGIYTIAAPLPFKSPPWVNVYIVEAGDGLLMIDCGTDWDEGRDAIRSGFASLGLTESSVHSLIVSHLHLDHVGMSKRLVEELGCRFIMHERASELVDRYNDTPGYIQRLRQMAVVHGIPETLANAATDIERAHYMPLIDKPDHVVVDGDLIDLGGGRFLEVLHTPGHESAHICLRDSASGILFSGDHVLPRISPVIMYDGEGDPLGDYMNSLQRLIDIGIQLTYPAHGQIVERGDERARQILLHHVRRLSDMSEMVREADTNAWEVMTKSFRPNLDPLQARLAFLETISHLERLRLDGRINGYDRDGKVTYGR